MNGLEGLLRYFGYAAFVATSALLIVWAGLDQPGGLGFSVAVPGDPSLTTSEFSPVEMYQCVLLVFCALVFAWIALRDRLRRPMAVGIATLFLLFLIRELDFFLDAYVIDNLWQVLGALATSVSGVYVFRHRDRLLLGWRRSWPSAGLGIMICGLFVLVPFAQIVATEPLWQSIMGDDYARSAKLAAEELMELAGYVLITIGSLEFLHGWSQLPETRTIDNPRRRRRRRRRRQKR